VSNPIPDSALRSAKAIVLRPATGSDLSAVTEIEQASFADPWSAREFASVLAVDHCIFLVAVSISSGEVVGYIVAIAVLDEGEILNVAVAPEVRAEGIGGVLLDAVLKQVEQRGTESMFLEVRVSNAAARALYQSRGFEDISKRKNYYRTPVEDALVMKRAAKR